MMYHHAPQDYACPFCSLLEGWENAFSCSNATDLIHQDGSVAAFVASHQWPNNPGNVLVVPREHFENVYDLPMELATVLQTLVKSVALAMKAVWGCDGVSIRQHNEPAGNQDVWHYHLHVTPRYTGDDFYANYTGQRALMPPEERARYARELRAYLSENRER